MYVKDITKKLFKRKLTIFSLIIFIFISMFGFSAPFLAPNDPAKGNVAERFQEPSSQYPLGTDHLGRCIVSRLMHGTLNTLKAALTVLVFTIIISITIGTIAGYYGGLLDGLLMRLCDLILAFPSLVLILVIVGMLGPSLTNVVIAMIAVQWVGYARIIRGLVLSYKEQNFILTARITGISGPVIILKHILPNVLPYVVVLATIDLGSIIVHIAGFSFIGLGVQPPNPEWGAMLNDGRDFLRSNPQMMAYPGTFIFMTVVSLNLLGDALRDAMEV